jgi:hypothetical protein
MAAKDEMRRKIQKSQNALREKKKKEREEKLANRVTKNPFHRKHGTNAEKKRINQLSHLSDKEKKNKIKNLNVPNKDKKKINSGKKEYTKAQLLAKKNIKEHGGTAKAAAANKAAMKLKIKKAYMAKKKKK